LTHHHQGLKLIQQHQTANQTKENKMSSAKLLEQLIDTNEVAERFGVRYMTVMDAIKAKKLASIQPAGRQGKHFVYLPEAQRWAKSIANKPIRKPQSPPTLFVADKTRNDTIIVMANDLMNQANALIAKAQELLKEID
jgi:hypothetical protein